QLRFAARERPRRIVRQRPHRSRVLVAVPVAAVVAGVAVVDRDQPTTLGSPCRVHAGDRVAGDGVADEGAAVLAAAGDVAPGVAVDQCRARFEGADQAADVEAARLGDVAARVGLFDGAGGELAGEAAGAGFSGDAAAGVAVEDAAADGGADETTGGFGAFHLAGGGGVPEIAGGAAGEAADVVVAAGEGAVSVAVLDVAGGFQ